MEVTIEKLAYGGEGVARTQPVTFVPRAAAGDVLDVELTEEKPRFRRARILSVVQGAADRQTPPCPHYQGARESESCGGCQYQHLRYAAQLAAKEEQVREAIARLAGLDRALVAPAIAAPAELGYRNKGTFHWSPERRAFGLVAADGKTLKPIDGCPLLLPAANALYKEAAAACDPDHAPLSLVVRASESTGETLAALVLKPGPGAESAAKRWADRVLASAATPTSLCWSANPRPERELFGEKIETLHGPGTIREKIGKPTFVAGPDTFLQVNTTQAAKLFAIAVEAAAPKKTDRVLDLYGGVGGISLTIAPKVAEVVGVESGARAVELGKRSARENEIANARFRLGRVESTLKSLHHGERIGSDLVFADPPRAGLKPIVIETISRMKPRRFVYVSCNPTTLARDLKLFVAKKWRVRSVAPVDLFPQTFHIEVVASLEPA